MKVNAVSVRLFQQSVHSKDNISPKHPNLFYSQSKILLIALSILDVTADLWETIFFMLNPMMESIQNRLIHVKLNVINAVSTQRTLVQLTL